MTISDESNKMKWNELLYAIVSPQIFEFSACCALVVCSPGTKMWYARSDWPRGAVCIRVQVCKQFVTSKCSFRSTHLKKVLSWKPRQVYFIYPFSRRLKLGKSLETCCVNFFFAWADIFNREKPLFGKHLYCKTRTDYTYIKPRVQDFATGKNFAFNQ